MDCQFMHDHFFLRDGVVHRKSSGRAVVPKPGVSAKSYPQTSVLCAGKKVVARLHRVRFALEHGYLPAIVDHKDRDVKNYASDNLRPSNKSLNAVNTGRRTGVSRKRGKWRAYFTLRGKQYSLGVFSTREEAQHAADTKRNEMYGEHFG